MPKGINDFEWVDTHGKIKTKKYKNTKKIKKKIIHFCVACFVWLTMMMMEPTVDNHRVDLLIIKQQRRPSMSNAREGAQLHFVVRRLSLHSESLFCCSSVHC